MKRLFVASIAALALAACATAPLSTKTEQARPLSAIAVTQCGLAVALFIQLDSTHLFRADPRQSDLFTAVNGEMQQTQAAPMKWADAYALAQKATLATHVVLPCTDGPVI